MVQKLKPDLVHLQGIQALLPGLVAHSLNLPVIWHLIGNHVPERWARFTCRFVKRWAQKIILVAPGLAQHYGLKEGQYELIWEPAIPAERFYSRSELAQELGWKKDYRWVLGVGHWSPAKNWPRFLEIAGHFTNKPYHFLLCGSELPTHPELAQFIREKANKYNVKLIDSAEARAWMQAFDVLLLSSDKEGTPLVILEALQAGLPVVASSIGGIPDLAQNNEGIFLANPINMDSYVEGLQSLASKVKLNENHCLDTCALRTKDAYQEVINLNKK